VCHVRAQGRQPQLSYLDARIVIRAPQASDIVITRRETGALSLELGETLSLVVGTGVATNDMLRDEAAAMRQLAESAGRVAGELEARLAAKRLLRDIKSAETHADRPVPRETGDLNPEDVMEA